MPISKKITDLKEPLEIDLQLMATELDTSVKNMKFHNFFPFSIYINILHFSPLKLIIFQNVNQDSSRNVFLFWVFIITGGDINPFQFFKFL